MLGDPDCAVLTVVHSSGARVLAVAELPVVSYHQIVLNAYIKLLQTLGLHLL